MKEVKPDKAAGPDGIHGMILKHCAFGLAYPLSKLFKISYNTGIIPKEWKEACVVPVHKKGSKSDVENYRPISLTCLIMKIQEKVVRDHIMEKCKHLIDPNQHGFLPAKSCTTQMLDYNESISLSVENNIQIDVVYFDFSKAFDSVHHDTLLSKLRNQFGINGRLLKYLENYLKGREQCVVVGGCKSEMRLVTSGVPQGSILGPLLFVLFINDIADDISEGTNVALYADDTKIWRDVHSWDDHEILQRDIDVLSLWSLRNKMKFHPDKCKVLSVNSHYVNPFHSIYAFPCAVLQYTLGGSPLVFVSFEKDLGVIVTDRLRWDDHCNGRLNVASSKLGLLKRVCAFTNNQEQKRQLYQAIVKSQFEHCCVVWRPTTDTMLNKFESKQRKSVKWILNEEDHHYNDFEYLCRLRDLKLLPMKYHFMVRDLIMFHKIYYDMCCVKLPSYYRNCTDEDRSRLRSNVRPPDRFNGNVTTTNLQSMSAMRSDQNSLRCDFLPSSATYRKTFFYRTHLMWNFVPLDVRAESCPLRFKNALVPHIWDLAMRPD